MIYKTYVMYYTVDNTSCDTKKERRYYFASKLTADFKYQTIQACIHSIPANRGRNSYLE